MNVDLLIKKTIEISKINIIKFFIKIFETAIFWYYTQIKKKEKKNINGKFFRFFQIFSTSGKLHSIHRRKKHEILIEKLNLNSETDSKVYEINNKGYHKLFEISQLEVENTIEYFYKQKIYNSHIPLNNLTNKLINIEEFLHTENYNYGSFDIKTSLNSGVIKKICSMKLIWTIAKKYLDSNNVRIYSINTMLTKKSKEKHDVFDLHRDFDCASSLVFFIYWTDTSKLNGATKVLPGSHLILHDKRLKNYASEPLLTYLEDKGGSIYALDTWALHAGNSNLTSPRLITWIRFCSMPAASYYLDRNYLFKDDLKELNQNSVQSLLNS